MLKFALNLLVVLSLSMATLFSYFVYPVELAAGQAAFAPNSPISPLSPSDDSDDNGGSTEERNFAGLKPSSYVWLPQTRLDQMWIKTHQIGLGWWDSQGQLHIALQVNGVIKLDLAGVTMISIPLDAAGFAIPDGWQKIKRPQNGEWVIIPIQ